MFPAQKISKAQRTPDWYKSCTDRIIDQATFYSSDKWEIIELYKAALGEIDVKSYEYVLNPFKTTEENYKTFPARLRNIDIITPILNLGLGEKADRPFNHQVINANPDTPNKNKQEIDAAFMQGLASHFVNALNNNGVDTGVESKENPDLLEVLKRYKVDATDKRSMVQQEALDYIKYNLSLKDIYQQAYFDWQVCARVYTYKDVYKNDLLYEIVPPLELWHSTTRTGYIEDCNKVLRHTRYSVNDVIDRFHEVLKPTEIEELEKKYTISESGGTSSISLLTTQNLDNLRTDRNTFNTNFSSDNLVDVYHTVWKGFEKIGILKYVDELGGLQEMEVSEEYVLNKEHNDLEIEWHWVNIVYENYKISDNIYVYGRPIQVQRNEISNTSKVKLPYNGRIGYNERDKVLSIVKQLLPYQALINIYYYRMELIIAKNKEKMMLMPVGLIPDSNGWTEDKFLYFMETLGIAFFDETKPNAQQILSALKSVDMSLGNYIEQMRNLITSIKNEAWDTIGMNRQRFGDINTSDGKATAEQAQIRSAVISREMNRRFEKFEESDLQGLLEYSKVAWIDGKKGAYINSEGRKALFELDGVQHLDTDCSVFVVDSQEEQIKLNKAKEYAFGVAQKGGVPYSTVLEIIDANNMSKLKALVNKIEDLTKEYEQQIAQNEHQNAMQIEQEKIASKDKEGQIKIEVENIKKDAAIEVALINNSADSQFNKKEESLEMQDNSFIDNVKQTDLQKQKEGIKVGNNLAATRLNEAKLEEARQKRLSAEKIARENKNKYDK